MIGPRTGLVNDCVDTAATPPRIKGQREATVSGLDARQTP